MTLASIIKAKYHRTPQNVNHKGRRKAAFVVLGQRQSLLCRVWVRCVVVVYIIDAGSVAASLHQHNLQLNYT